MTDPQPTSEQPAQPQLETTARVATDRPARYGKQLTSHMSRKCATTWDDADGGTIEFTGGTATLTCTDDSLDIRLTADADKLDLLEDVVGRHLVRFATKDTLIVPWVRADGTAGTTQRSSAE